MAASPLEEEDRSIWRNGALLFHVLPLLSATLQRPRLLPHKAFIILPKEAASTMLRGFRFLFCCSGIPAAHCSGNTALFSNREDGPAYIPITQLSYGLMKIMNPGHGEGTGCGCASRDGVQVASPLCRGAKGQETCGAKGAEEKVVSPDSVFLMTCISKRKARGYRKWLSLTAPGKCGKPAYLSVLSWLAGAMLNRSNGLRMGSRMQSSLRAFNQDLSFFFPY